MEIDGITLWLFGGIARFKGMFPSAGAEFRIAIAGPLVSLALGVVFVLLAWVAGAPEAADGVFAWLGYINLALLVFNLLPALPLDGGRVLRSALWAARGDFIWATRISAAIGRGFGYLFIAVGIFLLIFEGAFSGAWLAFMGWFLLQAAGAEDRYLLARQTLGGLRVSDVMNRSPVVTRPDTTLGAFMDDVVWTRRHTTYPVVDNGRAVGLLPFRCVAGVPRSEWDTRRVRDCMVPLEEVPVLSPDDGARGGGRRSLRERPRPRPRPRGRPARRPPVADGRRARLRASARYAAGRRLGRSQDDREPAAVAVAYDRDRDTLARAAFVQLREEVLDRLDRLARRSPTITSPGSMPARPAGGVAPTSTTTTPLVTLRPELLRDLGCELGGLDAEVGVCDAAGVEELVDDVDDRRARGSRTRSRPRRRPAAGTRR